MYNPDPGREKGIALLDEKGPPDWRSRVDWGKLDMGDVDRCMLGQIYSDYDAGLSELHLNYDQAVDFGFEAPELEVDEVIFDQYEQLTASWKIYGECLVPA